ncbi:hypothetical protein GCM10023083_60920 [Streptomyces phyllanthi]
MDEQYGQGLRQGAYAGEPGGLDGVTHRGRAYCGRAHGSRARRSRPGRPVPRSGTGNGFLRKTRTTSLPHLSRLPEGAGEGEWAGAE